MIKIGNLELRHWVKYVPSLHEDALSLRLFASNGIVVRIISFDKNIWTVNFTGELEQLRQIWLSQEILPLYKREYSLEQVKELVEQFLFRMNNLSALL